MKGKLLAGVAGLSLMLSASLAMAGGEACDSKKGHRNKDMSAEAMKEFKKNHPWASSGKLESSTDDIIRQPSTAPAVRDAVSI